MPSKSSLISAARRFHAALLCLSARVVGKSYFIGKGKFARDLPAIASKASKQAAFR